MQLFITSYAITDSIVTITEERVLYQLTHVLRAKIGYTCMVQDIVQPTIRYTIQIANMNNGHIQGKVINQVALVSKKSNQVLCIAFPNKFDKLELIVQKCTEIGIQHLIFFPSQYSQLRDISSNKIERLQKIALEATEQSYGNSIPTLSFSNSLQHTYTQSTNIVLEQGGKKIMQLGLENMQGENFFYVGPEGGWGEDDKKIFSSGNTMYATFTTTILRTETAAILTAWEAIKLDM